MCAGAWWLREFLGTTGQRCRRHMGLGPCRRGWDGDAHVGTVDTKRFKEIFF